MFVPPKWMRAALVILVVLILLWPHWARGTRQSQSQSATSAGKLVSAPAAHDRTYLEVRVDLTRAAAPTVGVESRQRGHRSMTSTAAG